MKYKYMLILILSLSLPAILIICFGKKEHLNRDFPEIEASGVLNVVTEYNSVDYYISDDSTIAGLQYELCRYLEKCSGIRVNIILESNLDACIKGLEKNTYDIIARNIPITSDNKEFLSFTVPITQNRQVLVQRKPGEGDSVSLIRNQIDLADKTVYIPQNSPTVLRLRNLSEEIAEPIYIRETGEFSGEQLIQMVACGEIDYAVVDKELALKNRIRFPETDTETEISFTQLQAWAVRKNAPILLDSLNRWIAAFKTLPARTG